MLRSAKHGVKDPTDHFNAEQVNGCHPPSDADMSWYTAEYALAVDMITHPCYREMQIQVTGLAGDGCHEPTADPDKLEQIARKFGPDASYSLVTSNGKFPVSLGSLLGNLDTKADEPPKDASEAEDGTRSWLPSITWMDGVEEREWDWLWPDKIPFGALIVFHGVGDLGKSWVCIDLACRASKGVDWPGGIKNTQGPIKSLLIGAEDDPERTIIKRIRLQEGDPSKIGIMSSAKCGDEERLFSLRLDVAGLELRIVEEGIKLVFIDPITEFYGEGVNGNSNEDVRRVLSPLVQLAQRQCVAIVALTHDGKRDTDTARNKALGSVALVNTARVSFYFTADPHDHNENFALRRRLMVPDKGNIFFEKQGLAYRWRGRDQPLVWDADPITQSADAIMADTIKAARENGTPREQAKAFLRDLLGDGQMDVGEVLRLGKEEGHSEATIKAAKRDMKIASPRDEFGGPCQWKLPDTHSVGP